MNKLFLLSFLLVSLLVTAPLSYAQVTPEETNANIPILAEPEFMASVRTQEDFDALTKEQQEELMTYLNSLSPANIASREQVVLPNTVSCFDYYTFGSVQVDLSATVNTAVSGAPLTFTGQITNNNPYPVVDGAVYVKIFRLPEDGSTPINGHDVVDQFFVEENIVLQANGTKDLSFTWNVPSVLTSGNYRAAFFYTSAHRFNLLGLSFTDDVVGNTASFAVLGEHKESVSLKKDTVTVNGEKYYFAAATPKESATEPVEIEIEVMNDTSAERAVPVTWTTYAWDAQREENKLKEETVTVSVPAKSSVRTKTTVTDTEHSVYLVTAKADYRTTSSILNIRFTRKGVTSTRINFPAVTTYPLTENKESTIFSCLHATGVDQVPNGKMVLTLTDTRDNVIHSYTYEGGVSGAMMGVKDTFVPDQTYVNFNLKAQLYSNDVLVDEVVMNYNCAELGAKCASSSAVEAVGGKNDLNENIMKTLVLMFVLVVILAAVIAAAMLRKKSAQTDQDSDDGTDPDNQKSKKEKSKKGGEGGMTISSLVLVAFLSTLMFMGGTNAVEAKSQSTPSVPVGGILKYHGGGYSSYTSYWVDGLIDSPSYSVQYVARVYNDSAGGTLLSDGDSVPVGTILRFEPDFGDVTYNGTGWSWDTPYGEWSDTPDVFPDGPTFWGDEFGISVSDVTYNHGQCSEKYLNNRYSITEFMDYVVYIAFTVAEPIPTIDRDPASQALLDCTGNVCTVMSAGAIDTDFNFPATYGKFWHEYFIDRDQDIYPWMEDSGCVTAWDEVPMKLNDGSGPDSFAVEAVTIPFRINGTAVAGSNSDPDAPDVWEYPDAADATEPNSHAIDDNQSFFVLGRDDDDDDVGYEVDWDRTDTDEITITRYPASGYVSNDAALQVDKAWSEVGLKQFRVRTEDSNGNRSDWTNHDITICSSGYVWNNTSGACEVPPPSGTLNAPTCEMPDGDSDCQDNLTWTGVTNVSNGVVTEDGVTIASSISGDGNTTITLSPTTKTYQLLSEPDGTVLSTRNLDAKCVDGTEWNIMLDPQQCAATPNTPDVTLDANPNVIRSGENTDIVIDLSATQPMTCELINAQTNPVTIDYAMNGDITPVGTIKHELVPTKTLTALQVVTLDCSFPAFPGVVVDPVEMRIEVLPAITEI